MRKKYCLYTDTTFGPHGLSLLITPEAAAAAQPVISAAYHSLFPDNATVQHFALGSGDRNPAYKVVDMPDKHGKGIVATRRIAKRDTFLVDWAALSGDLELWGSVPMREGKSILDLAALQLPDPEAVTGLSRKGADEDAGVVEGVIAVNTFRTYLDGAPMKTLFPLISVRRCPVDARNVG